jgi:histidinol-phosphate aminotransferase
MRRAKSTFSAHLAAGEVKNPFQGLPALEAAIGRKVVARIGSNEAMSMPKHPLADVLPADLLDYCRLYPDPYARDLRASLAKMVPGAVDNVGQLLIDSGGDSLIFLTLRTRIVPGDTVVTSAGTYPTFNYFAQGLGANIIEVPYADDGDTSLRPDLSALVSAAHKHNAAVVYLANPDNPTGHVFR